MCWLIDMQQTHLETAICDEKAVVAFKISRCVCWHSEGQNAKKMTQCLAGR